MTEEAHWFVLEHTPGPALGPGDSVFEHPAFGEHVAFLKRLEARRLLVAAGPLPDTEGAGMTVVRGTLTVEEVGRLATEDDRCVAAGVLQVRVRPWSVRFAG
ncbi:MAG: YciI family protein [Nocardioidaceae bacterium]